MLCERFELRDSSRTDKPLDLEGRFVAAFLTANLSLSPLRDISVNPRKPTARWHSGFEEPIMYGPRTTPAPEPPQLGGYEHF